MPKWSPQLAMPMNGVDESQKSCKIGSGLDVKMSVRIVKSRPVAPIFAIKGTVMAALHSRCGHYIFVLFLLGFFLAQSQRSQTGCLPRFYT